MTVTEQGHWSVERILGVSNAYWEGAVLQSAVVLGVFTALGESALPTQQLAESCGCDSRALEMLLDALCAMGLLIKENGGYRNTPESKMFLSKDSDQYLGHIVAHHFHLMKRWAQLPEAIRTGRPIHSGPPESEEQREAFLMGMFNLARLLAPRVAEAIDLSGRQKLLDLGGGPGTYAIHFCLAYPGLKATVYDLPTTRPYAEKTIESYGLSDRISFQAGNYLDQDIEGSFDVVWMSHILHSMGPQACIEVMKKAVATLVPGGVLYVHDFLLNETKDGPLFPALFSLNMLLNTKEGRAYSELEVRSMMEEAGLRHIHRVPFESPNSSSILQGSV